MERWRVGTHSSCIFPLCAFCVFARVRLWGAPRYPDRQLCARLNATELRRKDLSRRHGEHGGSRGSLFALRNFARHLFLVVEACEAALYTGAVESPYLSPRRKERKEEFNSIEGIFLRDPRDPREKILLPHCQGRRSDGCRRSIAHPFALFAPSRATKMHRAPSEDGARRIQVVGRLRVTRCRHPRRRAPEAGRSDRHSRRR